MVNCKNCGAPLSLEDAVCPYCGTANPEAQEHLKKLKQLDKDYRKTKFEVETEVKKSKKGYSTLIIFALILLANLILIPFHSATYEIAESISSKQLNKDEIVKTMNDLLEKGEWVEFETYFERYELSYHDYPDYSKVSNYANYYKELCERISDYMYATDPYSDPLVKTCEAIAQFEEEMGYLERRELPEQYKAYISRINDDYHQLLKTFLKLNDEDISSLSNKSSSDILLLVTRRLSNEEE